MVNNNNYLWYTSNSSTMPAKPDRHTTFDYEQEWLGNWNHHLRIGSEVICIQKYGRKVELPTNYEQEWTGTISIFELDRDTSSGNQPGPLL